MPIQAREPDRNTLHALTLKPSLSPNQTVVPMQYPSGDEDFKETEIDKVEQHKDATYTITCGGWSLWCGEKCPVEPKPGQTARQYGKGNSVRGLFINGVRVWYRTEAEDKEHHEVTLYGKDAAEWLTRWDNGDTVWTIEMGGLGPGYEQCIHITCAEILRWFIDNACDASKWADAEGWKTDREKMTNALHEVPMIKALGLSGAQWGAALNLATRLYLDGPRKVITDERVKDRHIQVSKTFPGSKAV
jgi:hypothetical protein